jgi:hypothetical protein
VTDTLHTFVYGLHEGDHDFWYVGMTDNPDRRLRVHRLHNPHATPDTQLHVLEEVTGTLDEVRPVEQEWIDGLRAVGYPLVNSEKDIPYGRGPQSDEARLRISEANRGRIHSKESRQANSKGHKGQVPWIKGRTLTDEHKAKLSATLLGRPGKPHSNETRRKMSETQRRADVRERKAAVSRRQMEDPEQRRIRREAARLQWAPGGSRHHERKATTA